MKELIKKAWELGPYATQMRRELHRQPELSEQEWETGRRIQRELQQMGIEVKTFPGTAAVMGILEGGRPGKAVALRADMDALPIQEEGNREYRSQVPGVMHACGHDGHMAILLGCARLLAGERQRLAGSVRFLFQPAEETVGGAEEMVRRGALDNPAVDAVFGLHLDPGLDCGKISSRSGAFNASSDTFTITVTGKGAHGAYPEQGIDALHAACMLVVSLQSLVSRRISASDSAVLTVGKLTAGTARNVMAEEAVLEGILRTTDGALREQLCSEIRCMTEQVCRAFGAVGRLDLQTGYAAIVNHPQESARVRKIAGELLGPEAYVPVEHPYMGVEDFAYFAKAAKGAYYQLGCKVPGGGPIHSPAFDMDEDALVYGIMLQTALTLDVLETEGER